MSSSACTFRSFWELFQQRLRPGQNIDLLITTPVDINQNFPSFLKPAEQELQLSQITANMIGQTLASVSSIPEEEELTQVEIEGAQKRWEAFCKEMRKPANYDSKYKVGYLFLLYFFFFFLVYIYISRIYYVFLLLSLLFKR
jgi:hypothetical protein